MLWWGLLIVLLGYAAWRLFGGYPRGAQPCEVLAPREVVFLTAAAEAIFPPGGAIPASGGEAGIPRYVDRYLAANPTRMRRLMRMLFLLVEQATFFLPAPGRGGRRRFSALTVEQRVAALRGWQRSRWFPRRLVFTTLRAILTMGYLSHPPVLRQLGLAPLAVEPPIVEADLLYPPVGMGPEAIRFDESDLTAPSAGIPLDPDGPLHPAYAEEPP